MKKHILLIALLSATALAQPAFAQENAGMGKATPTMATEAAPADNAPAEAADAKAGESAAAQAGEENAAAAEGGAEDATAEGQSESAETAETAAAEAGEAAHAEEAAASHATPEPPHQAWPHQGVFGKYDRAALQRGFQVYKEVCASCHAMKHLSYRHLEGLGYSPEQIKTVAAEYTVMDGPNDDGEMFERTARPSDHFKAPFANDKAARAANNGALPPDLSLIVKARHHNEDYIYALLTGYEAPPAGFALNPGMNYNKYFPNHQIAMAPPLMDGQVTYADGTSASVAQAASDVVQFLAWASEPHMEERKQTGLKVILFMLVFAGIMYAAKRRIWADAH